MRNFRVPLLITTPIYYANAAPHLGSAYTTIAADVLARHWRNQKRRVFSLTGTDEHGQKVADAAKQAGVDPQAFVDQQAKVFKTAFQGLNVGFDRFIRTTEPDHLKGVEFFLNQLKKAQTPKKRPAIYKGIYQGWYCQGCEKFLTEKELVEGKCPLHQTAPQYLTEENYFFRLSDYLPQIRKAISQNKLKIFPSTARQETLGYFKQGVQDFSISRQKVDWGVPLPFDKRQTAYVWVDALPNYLTGVGYGQGRRYRNWWRGEVVHFMARDILKFHAIYWPALLLAVGEPMPYTIVAHGFFTVEGKKMSKSLGNVILPKEAIAKFGVDGTRYLLLSACPFGQDGDLSMVRFLEKYNADLANGLGNLASRTTNMLERYLVGRVSLGQPPKPLLRANQHIENFDFFRALQEIWKTITWANQAIDKVQPWELAKKQDKTSQAKLKKFLSELAAQLLEIAKAIKPFMPEAGKRIEASLHAESIKKIPPLFIRAV
ncbi:methionine--tRNA ligase [Candidatus Parcubacteria bacterium]|nr:MAG: methionine--tRNA ligase [Candidatus Parcubacteria bacterium]